ILDSHLLASAVITPTAPGKSPPRLSTFREIYQNPLSSSHRNTQLARVPLRACSATIPPQQSSMDGPKAQRSAPSPFLGSTNVRWSTAPDARSPVHTSSSVPQSSRLHS